MTTLYFRFSVTPAADAAHPAPSARAATLEKLLARAGSRKTVASWREDAFNVIAGGTASMTSLAGAAQFGALGVVDEPWVCLATPVHCVAGTDRVRMDAAGVLTLSPDAAEMLAADFNRTLGGDGVRLAAGSRGELFCLFERALEVMTHDPLQVVGDDVWGFLPSGPDGKRLRRIMSETEMWLFDHPANRARSAMGLSPATGLWLWGAGPCLRSAPMTAGWTGGADPFFGAFSHRSDWPSILSSGVVVTEAGPPDGTRHSTADWRDAEQRWLDPAWRALRDGSLDELVLSAADRCFSVSARATLSLWRWTRPWRAYFS